MKIQLSCYDDIVTFESTNNDLTSTEVLTIFKSLMESISFSPSVVIAGMKEVMDNYESSLYK